MIIFKRTFLLAFFGGLIFLACPYFVKAAELSLDIASPKAQIGEQFQVTLLLDTQGESINALEGTISFPENLLVLKKISDGNSVVNFWVEKPQANSGAISFSGITPGGVTIKEGLVFSLTFEALSAGQADLDISAARALLNDGEGSPAALKILNLSLNISGESGKLPPVAVEVADNLPPESFNAELAQDKNIFDNRHFIVFATQDKGSGLAGYQVRESRSKFLAFLKSWHQAESPYLLQDQELKSYIFIKALDLNGNEKIEVIPPQFLPAFPENYQIYAIIILGIAIYILWKIFRRLQNHRR